MDALQVLSKPGAKCPSVTCHICGRSYGSTSIGIHQKTCLTKWEKSQAHLPAHLRKAPPKAPEIPIHGASAIDKNQYNNMAMDSFMNTGREECPNCGRGFASGRLEVHLRSCKPDGFFAKQREGKVQGSNNGKVVYGQMKRPQTVASPSSSSSKGASSSVRSSQNNLQQKEVPKAPLPRRASSAGQGPSKEAPRKTQGTSKEKIDKCKSNSGSQDCGFREKYCIDCGEEYVDKAKFCAECGHRRTLCLGPIPSPLSHIPLPAFFDEPPIITAELLNSLSSKPFPLLNEFSLYPGPPALKLLEILKRFPQHPTSSTSNLFVKDDQPQSNAKVLTAAHVFRLFLIVATLRRLDEWIIQLLCEMDTLCSSCASSNDDKEEEEAERTISKTCTCVLLRKDVLWLLDSFRGCSASELLPSESLKGQSSPLKRSMDSYVKPLDSKCENSKTPSKSYVIDSRSPLVEKNSEMNLSKRLKSTKSPLKPTNGKLTFQKHQPYGCIIDEAIDFISRIEEKNIKCGGFGVKSFQRLGEALRSKAGSMLDDFGGDSTHNREGDPPKLHPILMRRVMLTLEQGLSQLLWKRVLKSKPVVIRDPPRRFLKSLASLQKGYYRAVYERWSTVETQIELIEESKTPRKASSKHEINSHAPENFSMMIIWCLAYMLLPEQTAAETVQSVVEFVQSNYQWTKLSTSNRAEADNTGFYLALEEIPSSQPSKPSKPSKGMATKTPIKKPSKFTEGYPTTPYKLVYGAIPGSRALVKAVMESDEDILLELLLPWLTSEFKLFETLDEEGCIKFVNYCLGCPRNAKVTTMAYSALAKMMDHKPEDAMELMTRVFNTLEIVDKVVQELVSKAWVLVRAKTTTESLIFTILQGMSLVARRSVRIIVKSQPTQALLALLRSSDTHTQAKTALFLKNLISHTLAADADEEVKRLMVEDIRQSAAIPTIVQIGLSPAPMPSSAPAADSTTATYPNSDPSIRYALSRIDLCLETLRIICMHDNTFIDQAAHVLAGPGPCASLSSRLTELLTHWAFRKTSLKSPARLLHLDRLVITCFPNAYFQTTLEKTVTVDHCLILLLGAGPKTGVKGGFLMKDILELIRACHGHRGRLAQRIGKNIMIHVTRYKGAVVEYCKSKADLPDMKLDMVEVEARLKEIVDAASVLAGMDPTTDNVPRLSVSSDQRALDPEFNTEYLSAADWGEREIFAVCPYNMDGTTVEPVLDSSRYFVLTLVEPTTGKRAYIGMGFPERSWAFDFNVALQDHVKRVKNELNAVKSKEQEQSATHTGPKVDLSLKADQKITINIGGLGAKKKANEGSSTSTSGGFGILLPPPPSAKSTTPTAGSTAAISASLWSNIDSTNAVPASQAFDTSDPFVASSISSSTKMAANVSTDNIAANSAGGDDGGWADFSDFQSGGTDNKGWTTF
ncbi:hypothetical protein HDV05_002830 [Chytridiales sp. JEL 0842]|nr:hypothetical protein HDV05_002830 [Chytridiales sp. JEL 0842]